MATFAINLLTGNSYLFDGTFSGTTGSTSGTTYPQVGAFAELPTPASSYNGEIYVVRTASGNYMTGIKDAGLYWSNGLDWVRLGDITQYFNSDNFQIYDGDDKTKGIEINTGGISSGVFRTITVPNKNGTLIYQADVNTYTGTTAPNTFLKLNQTTPQRVIGNPRMDGIQFVTTGLTTPSVGKLFWNANNSTLEYGLNSDVNIQIGQETVFFAVNKTDKIIPNGTVVYVNGAQGSAPTIGLADNGNNGLNTIGVTTQEFSINGRGYVTLRGVVRSLNTNAYSAGTTIYLNTGGTWTNQMPDAPKTVVRIGTVLYQHQNQGQILVSPLSLPKLSDLSDVDGTPLSTTGLIPVWDNTNKYFDFTSNINDFVHVTGDTITGILNVSGITKLGSTFNVLGVSTLKNALNVSGITTLGSTVNILSTPALGDITRPTLFWNPSSNAVEAIHLTGGTSEYHYADKYTPATTTNTCANSVKYLGYTANTFSGGRYRIDVNTRVGNMSNNKCTGVQFLLDGVVKSKFLNVASFAEAEWSETITRDETYTPGTHCIDIRFYDCGGGTACVARGVIRIAKIC
jgi:hypothetical protein